jgi:hypothetical protein
MIAGRRNRREPRDDNNLSDHFRPRDPSDGAPYSRSLRSFSGSKEALEHGRYDRETAPARRLWTALSILMRLDQFAPAERAERELWLDNFVDALRTTSR